MPINLKYICEEKTRQIGGALLYRYFKRLVKTFIFPFLQVNQLLLQKIYQTKNSKVIFYIQLKY